MIKVIHFNNGKGGGVFSVIKNLLKYKQCLEFEYHVIYLIESTNKNSFVVPRLQGAKSEKILFYSANWNLHYLGNKLSEMITYDDSILVAHDWLELRLYDILKLKNPLIYVLHGNMDYYYNLSIVHRDIIDWHICVSPVIEKRLVEISNISNVSFLRFPIPDVTSRMKQFCKVKIAYYVFDLSLELKQFNLLPLIEKELVNNGCLVEWFIAGGGVELADVEIIWGENFSDRVNFYGRLDQEEIGQLIDNCNVFLLPSLTEGLPVSLIESMKSGLVPLTSHWAGAVEDILINNETGFYLRTGDYLGYANRIKYLFDNPDIFKTMSVNASIIATKKFDPNLNAIEYEKVFLKEFNIESKKYDNQNLSRLDRKYFPNFVVSILRYLKSLVRNVE